MNEKIVKCISKVVEVSPRGWLVIDRQFRIAYLNETFVRLWETDKEFTVGTSLLDYLYGGRKKNSNGQYYGPLIETMDTGREFRETETYLPTSFNKSSVWFLVDTYLIRDSEGGPEYAVGNYIIIDKFKAIEKRLDNINLNIIKAFSRAIGARDAYTSHHDENVAQLMVAFAETLQLPPEEVTFAYLAGAVHDVGKIGIPEPVLNKPGRLTDEEYQCIKRHAAIGADIIGEVDGLCELARIVRYHHERYDGRGYPDGLAGEDIPLFSRMLALCDSYDAMTSVRCYRIPVRPLQALVEIQRCAGTQFDPALSIIFLEMMKKLLDADCIAATVTDN